MTETSVETVGPYGGDESLLWDDGAYSTVRQIDIYVSSVIESIRIEYDDNGRSLWAEKHGYSEDGEKHTVKLDYPHEFLISISGHTGGLNFPVQSLTFQSNRRTYGPFGTEKGDSFKIQASNGKKILGFHGRSEYQLDGIGAYAEQALMPENSVQTVGPYGGEESLLWDDGGYSTVRQVDIYVSSVIESIQIEYDDKGSSVWAEKHGYSEDGNKYTVELDYPREFLISISGHIGGSNLPVQSLTFETNRRTYGPFGTEKGDYFKIQASSGKKIIGFHGRSDYQLDGIGAYVEPSVAANNWTSGGPFGGEGGVLWNDGVHTTIRKLVIFSSEIIHSIEIEYDERGQSKWSNRHGTKQGKGETVELDYPGEFLISISGYIGSHHSNTVVSSITFESNRRSYGPFGTETGTQFKFPSSNGRKIVGFHGRSGDYLDSIGVYLGPISNSSGGSTSNPCGSSTSNPSGGSTSNPSLWISVGPIGGTGGARWDDGVHTAVRQLIILSSQVIESIQIQYDKNGQPKWSDTHGIRGGRRTTVELDYPSEFLTSISGCIGSHYGITVVSAITFESNKRTYGPFGTISGTQFKFSSSSGAKIMGFYGSSGDYLDSIGAYLGLISNSSQGPTSNPSQGPTSNPSQWISVGPYGGTGGDRWDDGIHTSVRQLIIFSSEVIESIRIQYDKEGQSKWSETHGREVGRSTTVRINHPNEFLISVSGHIGLHNSLTVIRSLTLKTNWGTYGPYGTPNGTYTFELSSSNSGKIIGFYGSSGWHLDNIGAYISKPQQQDNLNFRRPTVTRS